MANVQQPLRSRLIRANISDGDLLLPVGRSRLCSLQQTLLNQKLLQRRIIELCLIKRHLKAEEDPMQTHSYVVPNRRRTCALRLCSLRRTRKQHIGPTPALRALRSEARQVNLQAHKQPFYLVYGRISAMTKEDELLKGIVRIALIWVRAEGDGLVSMARNHDSLVIFLVNRKL